MLKYDIDSMSRSDQRYKASHGNHGLWLPLSLDPGGSGSELACPEGSETCKRKYNLAEGKIHRGMQRSAMWRGLSVWDKRVLNFLKRCVDEWLVAPKKGDVRGCSGRDFVAV